MPRRRCSPDDSLVVPGQWRSPDDSSRRLLTSRPKFLGRPPPRELESLVVPGRRRSPDDSSRRWLTSRTKFLDEPPQRELESLVVIRCLLNNEEGGGLPGTFTCKLLVTCDVCDHSKMCGRNLPQFYPRFTPDLPQFSIGTLRSHMGNF